MTRSTLGYALRVVNAARATAYLGAAGSWNALPSTISVDYGGPPASVLGFIRLAAH